MKELLEWLRWLYEKTLTEVDNSRGKQRAYWEGCRAGLMSVMYRVELMVAEEEKNA